MNEDSKVLDDDIEEFPAGDDKNNLLNLMRNMMEAEHRKIVPVEIFDENNHDIYPTS